MYQGSLNAASNRADWKFTIELFDPVTSTFVDLTTVGTELIIGLRPDEETRPRVSGSLADGHITIAGPGLADVRFTRSEMTQFDPGSMEVGITIKFQGVVTQLFAGTVPVIDGVVNP